MRFGYKRKLDRVELRLERIEEELVKIREAVSVLPEIPLDGSEPLPELHLEEIPLPEMPDYLSVAGSLPEMPWAEHTPPTPEEMEAWREGWQEEYAPKEPKGQDNLPQEKQPKM